MPIPTKAIGSIPRPSALLTAMCAHQAGQISNEQLLTAQQDALRNTVALFEQTGSPVITDVKGTALAERVLGV